MMNKDILGKHAGGRHINFDVMKPCRLNPIKLKYVERIHVFLK